ncbi:sigma-54 dependent transcriptional regulator [Mangrovibacterium marinum]|uniref:DNA-binding NtrC family response regulator n=1 Tax=Mangrovibacterium marinum TaxID=1639118 RepID=A0A2T5C6G5_9BACT|nr:sigma-54 dependent transcriptional regulator [Mangrovibacterium marinum]PTN10547.1 DNA-binding NtrC family response regulator [Mangrovibacterium marinum]
MNKKLKILVVESDGFYGKLARSILKNDFDVDVLQAPTDALELLRKTTFDIVIIDYNIQGGNGLRLLKRIKSDYPKTEAIMTGPEEDASLASLALAEGAIDYFQKPFDYESIILAIQRTEKFLGINKKLETAELNQKVLRNELERHNGYDIISCSPAMDEVKMMMAKVAQSDSTSVIITGESGVGKELVARGIHNMSPRKENYFGAVNMSAISDTLFESEFFGHKKGAFTGAIGDRAGWFEIANQGSLFLDEIGDMPINQQIKMLRVLEDRKFIKVGAQNENIFDVRIISATNKNIDELKNGKDFRLDLFHRIGTFEIYVPPLRERSEDIPLLLDHFMRHFATKVRKQINRIDPETVNKLSQYNFPGNVRELRNIVERAVILCDSHTLKMEHFKNIIPEDPAPRSNFQEIFDLEIIEKETILRALQKVSYNKSQAAKLLNLKWNALYRRLQKYEIALPE